MTSTPPKFCASSMESLGESWIDFTTGQIVGMRSPERITPQPISTNITEEYLRLLREAQRESNHSSRVVSLASSRRDTPRDSPKSPPNSPNNEQHTDEHLENVYINYWSAAHAKDSDWLWEWSSRPELPPKGFKGFESNSKKSNVAGYSMRQSKIGKNSLFSRDVLYSLILTNVLSLLLGTGLGLWISKRFVGGAVVAGGGGGTLALTKIILD